MGSHFWWYLSRASGTVAFGVITSSVAFGLVLSTRLFGRSVAPAWLMEMHKFLGILGIIATGIHMGSLMADNYAPFSLADLLIPFATHWKPGAVAWGVLAFWLLTTIQISSWCMKRMPRAVWHAIHMTSFVLFASAMVHGLLAGTEGKLQVAKIVAIATTMTVLFLGVVRVLAPRRAQRKQTRVAAAAATRQAATPTREAARSR